MGARIGIGFGVLMIEALTVGLLEVSAHLGGYSNFDHLFKVGKEKQAALQMAVSLRDVQCEPDRLSIDTSNHHK